MAWNDDNKWEAEWWGNCGNTYQEETKQLVYARLMGMTADMVNGKYPVYDLKGKTVLDIGGGPVSMLLKCINLGESMVVDPCPYPSWIEARYQNAGIGYITIAGEDLRTVGATDKLAEFPIYDEVWIYNVLQHVMDPEKIIANARELGRIIRLFEWVNMPPEVGHPQTLIPAKLDEWLGGIGKTEQINERGCHGECYYGIFLGNHYAKV